MTDRDKLIELIDCAEYDFCLFVEESHEKGQSVTESCTEWVADHLLANGVIVPTCEEKKMVYFPFPIDCKECPKVVADIGVCEELDLLYAGKHPKYTKEQDWEFMCANCPHEVHEREYEESDEKHIGKTVFLTKEEAEEKLKELRRND